MVTIANLIVLEVGKKVPLGPGDSLVVEYQFNYICSEPADVILWVSLGLATGRDIEGFDTLHLNKALSLTAYSGAYELVIPTSGKANGTYWMKVEVNGTEVTIQNAVVLGGFVSIWGALELIPMLVVVMMMSMMMNMMNEGAG